MPGGKRYKNPTRTKKNYHCRQDDLYDTVGGIKFLSGCTETEFNMHKNSIDFYSQLVPVNLQSSVVLSTIAAIGLVKGIKFNEEFLMQRIVFNPDIFSVTGCGTRIINPEYATGTERIKVGSFRCQITLEVFGGTPDKRYKIKVFRNGVVHIPGITRMDMHDSIEPLRKVCKFFGAVMNSENVKPEYVKAIMRNCGCVLNNSDSGIIIRTLKKCLSIEQKLKFVPIELISRIYALLKKRIGSLHAFIFMRYIKWSFMQIKKPRCNRQKTSGILVKFDRYLEPNIKDLTIRILTSGKITFNGSNSEIEILNSYWWLNFIFAKYYEEVIYDPSRNRAVMKKPPDQLILD